MKLSVNKNQNRLVCVLGTLLLFNWFSFQNLPSDAKRYRTFRETGRKFLNGRLALMHHQNLLFLYFILLCIA